MMDRAAKSERKTGQKDEPENNSKKVKKGLAF